MKVNQLLHAIVIYSTKGRIKIFLYFLFTFSPESIIIMSNKSGKSNQRRKVPIMYFQVYMGEFQDFLADFYNDHYPHQRMGQAFINQFMPAYDVPEPEDLRLMNKLFYIDDERAMKMIVDHFITWEDE